MALPKLVVAAQLLETAGDLLQLCDMIRSKILTGCKERGTAEAVVGQDQTHMSGLEEISHWADHPSSKVGGLAKPWRIVTSSGAAIPMLEALRFPQRLTMERDCRGGRTDGQGRKAGSSAA